MKKIILSLFVGLFLTGCEDFLDSEPTNLKTIENYPATQEDADQVLTGIYSVLAMPDPLQTSFLSSELRSDNLLGGGGPTDISTKAIAQCQKWSESSFAVAWRTNYMGIFRANVFLEALDKVEWNSEEDRKRMEGEARFLRAHYYFDLSRMFGDVCLITTSESVNIPRTPAAETYAFIAADLKKAIEDLLPTERYDAVESGRVTKWAAQALMARVFLFYTGYYQKESLPLPDGGEISKDQVIAWLDECTDTSISGHDLVSDFRNLWPYSYVQDYKFTKNNNLKWEGDGNKETVFAIKYSNKFTNWDYPYQKSNQICLYLGLRGQNYLRTFPFGQGWGFGTVNPKIWEDWFDDDIRKTGSIFNVTNRNEVVLYTFGADSHVDETSYVQKKYIPINVYADGTHTVVHNYSMELYGNTVDNYMLNNTQDLVLIRFADVLLMAAELNLGTAKAQSFLDRVRARVNLPSVPATLDNIKAERRFELAFEGVRFYDLLRWHDADRVLNENQKDIVIYRSRTETVTKTITYRPETNGFLQIPLSEIELSKGVLTANPGWGSEAAYQDIY